MTDIQGGRVERYVGILQTYTHRFGLGAIASDGIALSAVVTFGTTEVEIFNELVDPGFTMQNKSIYVDLIQKFTEVKNAVGSCSYYWRAREENQGSIHSWVNLLGNNNSNLKFGLGSLANLTATLSGYLPVGSFPASPIRVSLMAAGLVASSMTGQFQSNSKVELYGAPIPGA